MENPQLASECMYTKGAFGCIWYVQLYNTSGTWSYVEEERKTRWSNSLLRLPRSWSRLPLCCLDARSFNQVDAWSDCPKSNSSEMKCMLSQQLFLPLPEEKELQAHLKSGALSTLHVAFSREAGTLIELETLCWLMHTTSLLDVVLLLMCCITQRSDGDSSCKMLDCFSLNMKFHPSSSMQTHTHKFT